MSGNDFFSESEKRNLTEFDEHGVVNINYDLPEINLQSILNKDAAHITLPKCTSSPTNAYDLERREK